ncbi:MAG: hypothetical protein P9M14_10990 [Candidatus Alcyoniella australis]|nr:hypothetical protein [Candidatus Alcyoniella australis]
MRLDLNKPIARSALIAPAALLLLLALCVACWINLSWAALDLNPLPPELDSFKYSVNARQIAHQALSVSDRPDLATLIQAWHGLPLRVFNAWVLLPAWLTTRLGPGRTAEVAALLPALILLVLAAAALGRTLLGPAQGLLAALIVLAFPAILGFTRVMHLEVSAMALAAWLPLAAWRMRAGFRPLTAIFTGLLLSAGMLVRYEFPIYALPAIVAGLCAVLLELRRSRDRLRHTGRVGLNLFLSLASFGLGLWLYFQIVPSGSLAILRAGLSEGPFAPEFSLPGALGALPFLALPVELFRVSIEPWWALAAIASMPLALSRANRKRRAAAFLVAYCLAALAFLSAWPNRESRRLLLVLPALAVLISVGLVQARALLPKRRALMATAAICVALGLGWVRVLDLSFDPQVGRSRSFVFEQDVPRSPRGFERASLDITCALLRHGQWPQSSSAAIMGTVSVEPAEVMLYSAYYGMSIVPIYSYEHVGIEHNPLFYRLGPPLGLILTPDREPCGPITRREDFGYVPAQQLDELCADLPPYRSVDAVADAEGKQVYVLRHL